MGIHNPAVAKIAAFIFDTEFCWGGVQDAPRL